MGKKSLIKSTTKKKAASPKKSASKQAPPSAKPTNADEKKTAAPKKSSASKAPPKPARKKMSVSELLKLSFETWSPDKLYEPSAGASVQANYTAPPFFEGTSKETETLKALLTIQFDLNTPPEATKMPSPVNEEIPAVKAEKEDKATEAVTEAPAPDEAPAVAQDTALDAAAIAKSPATEPASPIETEPAPKPPRKTAPISELLKLSFETWSPDKLYAPPADASDQANYTAPPFFDGAQQETITVKALLFKQFDLNAPPEEPVAPADEPKPTIEEAPETPSEPQAPPTPEIVPETPSLQESAPAPEPEIIPAPEPEKAEAKVPERFSESAPETEPYIPPTSPVCAEPPVDKEPPNTSLRMLIGCLAIIFGILLIASALNSSKYYLQPAAAGLEIWRGKFSPTGKTLVATVPDAELSIPVASIYSREGAMTVVYDYYMQEAAKRSTVIGEPDFKAITGLYEKAKKYAPTAAQAGMADARLKTITAQSLIIAADKAIVKITPQNIDKALGLLHEAASLATDRTQQQLIRVKIDELTAMKAEKAEKETGATPAAP